VDGVAGLWLAYRLDLPPGPAIAVVGGVLFALAAAGAALRRRATVSALAPTSSPGPQS